MSEEELIALLEKGFAAMEPNQKFKEELLQQCLAIIREKEQDVLSNEKPT